MKSKPAQRNQQFFGFLRRLRADGRSNMYGAIPYLMNAFGLDRDDAFRVVCDWLDHQAAAAQNAASLPSAPRPARRSRGRAA
jgi:hypothetical protein